MCTIVGRCVVVVASVVGLVCGGCWLKKQCHCFQQMLLPTHHPNSSVHIHPILCIFSMWKLMGYVLKYYRTHNLILVYLISNRVR